MANCFTGRQGLYRMTFSIICIIHSNWDTYILLVCKENGHKALEPVPEDPPLTDKERFNKIKAVKKLLPNSQCVFRYGTIKFFYWILCTQDTFMKTT